jgi:hypothetical protein
MNRQTSPDHGRSSVRISRREQAFRVIAALSLSGTMLFTVLATGNGGARAQAASVGTAEAVLAPETSVLYFGVSLDTTSPQWTIADQLLANFGVDNGAAGLLNSLTSSTTIEGGDQTVDTSALLGGEAAVIVTNLDAASSGASSLSGIVGSLNLPVSGASGGNSILDIGTPTTSESGATSNTGSVVVVKPTDLTAATKVADDAMTAAAANLDVQIQTTTYNGVTVKSYPGNPDTGDTGAAYAVVAQNIALAETQKDLEPIIDTAAGTTKPLSGVEAFGKADQALSGDRLGFGFINGAAIGSDLDTLDSTTSTAAKSFGGLIGTDRSTGISVIADPAGFRFNTVAIPNNGQAATAGGVATDLSLASKVPADSAVYANGFEIGQGSLLQGLALYLVTALQSALSPDVGGTPAALPSVDELFSNAAQFLGFNLKLDFIEQLVGQYAFALWNVDINDPTQIGMILTSDVKDPAKLSDALSKLSLVIQAASTGTANVTTETVNNSNVSVVTIGSDSTSPSLTIDYGVVDGKFLLGTNDSIKTYLGGFSDSLADSPEFKAGLAALPAEYDGIYFVNLQEALALGSSAMSSLGSSGGSLLDNSESCGNYTTQAKAQAAYDADSVTNYDLDLNFNGKACEDYFAPATPKAEASPEATSQYSVLKSFTTVSYKKDGLAYTSSILLISNK